MVRLNGAFFLFFTTNKKECNLEQPFQGFKVSEHSMASGHSVASKHPMGTARIYK